MQVALSGRYARGEECAFLFYEVVLKVDPCPACYLDDVATSLVLSANVVVQDPATQNALDESSSCAAMQAGSVAAAPCAYASLSATTAEIAWNI